MCHLSSPHGNHIKLWNALPLATNSLIFLLRERGHFIPISDAGDIGKDERIILKRIFRKQNLSMWIGSIWLILPFSVSFFNMVMNF